jgi:acetyl-CoA carboxylase biotin carboxylase subunit
MLHQPGGPGIRFDSHLYSGYSVPPYYDSMIGKLIAYGNDRNEVLARLRHALEETVIEGIKTNIELHQKILRDGHFEQGGTNIHYLEQMLKD